MPCAQSGFCCNGEAQGLGLRPTHQRGGQGALQSVFACQRMLTETFLETVQDLERVQEVDKVFAAQGSPALEANDEDAQETSCLQKAAGS